MNLYEDEVYASELQDHYWQAVQLVDSFESEPVAEFYPEPNAVPPF